MNNPRKMETPSSISSMTYNSRMRAHDPHSFSPIEVRLQYDAACRHTTITAAAAAAATTTTTTTTTTLLFTQHTDNLFLYML
jgi:hypothetical protein